MGKVYGDVSVETGPDARLRVEIHRPPNNFFDVVLIRSLADAYSALDEDPECRCVVLCSEGKHFCAGADFNNESSAEALPEEGAASLYQEAVRLFVSRSPWSRRCKAQRSAEASAWRVRRTFELPHRRLASLPTSPGWASIRASDSASHFLG